MDSDDTLLQAVARDGSVELSQWPTLLQTILAKLDYAVHEEFPIPTTSLLNKQPSEPVREVNDTSASIELPHQQQIGIQGPRALEDGASTDAAEPTSQSQAIIPDSQPPRATIPNGLLPTQLLAMHSNLKSTLTNSFSQSPPHTVQRLVELIQQPSAHYRSLPSYLRALDRVVSVSSTTDAFPLPSVSTNEGDGSGSNLLAATSSSTAAEDFHGAALTRIPWLRDTAPMMIGTDRALTSDLRTESTAVIDGPNGAGSIETVTVSVNGNSQSKRGDLATRHDPLMASANGATSESSVAADIDPNHASDYTLQDGDERVQARGPEEIGVSDMGPQQTEREGHVFDAEAAVGRPGEAERVAITDEGQPSDSEGREASTYDSQDAA